MIKEQENDQCKHLQIEHLISKNKYPIYLQYDEERQKSSVYKIYEFGNMRQEFCFINHFRTDLMGYFQRKVGSKGNQWSAGSKGNQWSSIIPLSYWYFESIEKRVEKDEQNSNMSQLTKIIYASRNYMDGESLRSCLLSKHELVCQQNFGFIPHFVGSFIDFLLQFGGVDNFIPTSENIFIDQIGEIHYNYLSITGLFFAHLNQSVRRAEFQEIYHYLDPNFVNRPPKCRINLTTKIRSLAIHLLSLILLKDIRGSDHFEGEISFESAGKYILRVKDHFEKLFQEPSVIGKLKEVDRHFVNRNYTLFLKKVLVEEEQLSWAEAFQYLSIRENESNPEGELSPDNSILDRRKQINQNMSQMHQHILQYMYLQDKIKHSTEEQIFYHQRGLLQPQIFLAVKFNFGFKNLLNYENWFDMISRSNQTASKDLFKGCLKLLEFLFQNIEKVPLSNRKDESSGENKIPTDISKDISPIKLLVAKIRLYLLRSSSVMINHGQLSVHEGRVALLLQNSTQLI